MLAWAARATAACAAAAILSACGGSDDARSQRPNPLCPERAQALIARFVSRSAAAVSTSVSKGNDAAPQCTFVVRARDGKRIEVLANVQTIMQAYFVLLRTISESEQIFGPVRLFPGPIQISGLGLEASWFPNNQWLEATDGRRLVTTSVDWSGSSQSTRIELAERVTRVYLHTPHGKLAEKLSNDYP
jgi:hypothetical protein